MDRRKGERKKQRKKRLRLKPCNLSHRSVNSTEIQECGRQTDKKAGETIPKCQGKEAY